jgi:exopolyphosphatase/guanosine-5'-triphosphate,3'-diphosphate pyrophosphatase
VISTPQLRGLFDLLAPLTLDERRRIPGLPPGRADVFPIAVLTLVTVAEAGGLASFHNSLCNLRHGLAAEVLG